MIKAYGAVRLLDIEAARPGEWDFSGATLQSLIMSWRCSGAALYLWIAR